MTDVYVHPKYIGGSQLGGGLDPDYDLAIVVIPDTPQTAYMKEKRVQARFNTATSPVGTSFRVRGTGALEDIKKKGDVPNMAIPGMADQPKNDAMIDVHENSLSYISAIATSATRVCRGDSGGPALEYGRVRLGKRKTKVPIVWGIIQAFFQRLPRTRARISGCAPSRAS